MKLKRNTSIGILKVTHDTDLEYTQEEANLFEDGNRQNGIPENYSAEGFLNEDVVVGEPLKMIRLKRNGVSAYGSFTTSIISEIIELSNGITMLTTQNSTYKVTVL